jgi:hypothetical protein
MRTVLHMLSAAALCYAALTILLGSAPWWRFLPDLAMPISAMGCGGAQAFQQAYESDELLRRRIVPVVMTAEGYRGPEDGTAAQSCVYLAEAMRKEAFLPRLVPKRFLCQSVRRWIYELYTAEGLDVGPALWVIRGKAVGSHDLYEALSAEGIAYTKDGVKVVP